MEIVPIKTKRDYHHTLKEIEGLMTAKRNTPEGDRLDVLVTLIEAWEAQSSSRSTRPDRRYPLPHGTKRARGERSDSLYQRSQPGVRGVEP